MTFGQIIAVAGLLTTAVPAGVYSGWLAVDDYLTTREVAYWTKGEREKDIFFSIDRDARKGMAIGRDRFDRWCAYGKRYGYLDRNRSCLDQMRQRQTRPQPRRRRQ